MKVKNVTLKQLQRLWRFTEQRAVKRVVIGFSIIVLLVAGTPVVLVAFGQMAYRSNDFATAQKIWWVDAHVSWYEKDVPYADAGVAYYQAGNMSQAIDQLERALKIVAPSRNCKVRWNLAVASVQRADQLSQSQPNDAMGNYARAINVLDDQTCLSDPSYKDKFTALSDSLKLKLEALVKQINDAHTRPADAEEKNKTDTTTSDADKAKEEQKKQNDYQHDLNMNRYDQQSDDEKNKSYSEHAW